MTTEVRPPPGTAHGTFHWIADERGKQFVALWLPGQRKADLWLNFGQMHGERPSFWSNLGYRYLEPVVPPSGGAGGGDG